MGIGDKTDYLIALICITIVLIIYSAVTYNLNAIFGWFVVLVFSIITLEKTQV